MCGIAGLLWFEAGRPVNINELRAMCDLMEHRGPDDEGFFVKNNIGLGHRRLSIIDLSSAAYQPMSNENGTIWLTFNGEIYNYLELIPELEAKGHKFKSHADSEIIIHAYEEYGTDCVQRFNGMWAFAVWDETKQRLFLSRDRFGVKPLHYYLNKEVICFSSEIKPILARFPELRSTNEPYLYRFLTTGVPNYNDETFFAKIKSLAPAHSMTVNKRGEYKTWKHWDYNRESVNQTYDYSAPEETFRELLKDAVRLRLRSDVPIGTCLSGGLDSSSIVALMSQEVHLPIKTFSALYADPDCDESSYVNIMNGRFNTQPFPVYPRADDLFDVLSKIVCFQNEPSAAPGLYSQWLVMQEAHGKVKVLLDGQGGDELLGGYFSYFDHYLFSLLSSWTKTRDSKFLSLFFEGKRGIRGLTGQFQLQRLTKLFLKQLLRYSMSSPLPGLANLSIALSGTAQCRYGTLHPEFADQAKANGSRPKRRRKLDSLLDTMLYDDLTVSSIPALLRYEDRNSMAFSIEARTPFLDYRLVEFCLGLPYTQKIDRATTKSILRRSLTGILPEQIVNRSDKKGYPTPFNKWLREDECRQAKEILLSSECRKRRIFDHRVLEQSLKKHAGGQLDLSWEIWRLITTELWFRQFIDQAIPGAIGAKHNIRLSC
ncbi:MAG: asparagine synthase (glutamine-hydrolyzing) [Actinomycetota bacterium]|nr:asparagine synthase (glutamine-hydrolyzing) [Actinomycetota bacterium]